jgi:outer membrane protein assembly factor BamB
MSKALNTRVRHAAASIVGTSFLICAGSVAAAQDWLLHGQGLENNANGETAITPKNIDEVELRSIYNIDTTNAGGKTRGENAVGSGIALTASNIAYVPTTDGRVHVLDLRNTSGTNPDGTPIPLVLNVFDIVADPEYTGASASDGDDIVMNRMHPTVTGDSIYVGNYNLFLAFDAGGFSNDLMGVPMLTNGLAFQSQGAVLMSINKDTGDLNWKTVIDDNPHSMITNSPTTYNGVVYASLSTEVSGTLGISPFSYLDADGQPPNPGVDPFLGLDPMGNPLPTDRSGIMYRNAVVALDEGTGEVLWKTYVMPKQQYRTRDEILAAGGIDLWNGGSAWGGGNFPIDTTRNLIFVGTGEAYNSPLEADACEDARLQNPMANPFSDECLDIDQDGNPIAGPITNVPEGPAGVSSSSHPLTDSVIALDLDTGEIRWAQRMQGFDVWNFACLEPVFSQIGLPADNFFPACPPYLRGANFGLNFFAKDLDVGEQPMLVRDVKMPMSGKRDLLIVTSKAANIWALDPGTGDIVWKTESVFGPGSLFGGGILWGSATDGERMYLTSTTSNISLDNLDALNVVPGSCPDDAFNEAGNLNGGVYAAVDLGTGEVVWQRCLTAEVVDANGNTIFENGEPVMAAGFNEGPVSVAGGVVYVPGPTTIYGFLAPDTLLRAQVVALDAETGAILKRLPFNAPGEPSGTRTRYTRPVITEDTIVIGNGLKDDFLSGLARRVVVYGR